MTLLQTFGRTLTKKPMVFEALLSQLTYTSDAPKVYVAGGLTLVT